MTEPGTEASQLDTEMERLATLGFRARGIKRSAAQPGRLLWDARFHGFHASALWNEMNDEKKYVALHGLQSEILTETYFIEGAGMTYSAQMLLLAETADERQYFATMGAEEASHYHMLSPFFPEDVRSRRPNAFTALIGDVVSCGERQTSLLVLQILLEGWGLEYYQALAEHALVPEISNIFCEILRDESRHHSGGVLLHRRGERTLSPFCEHALVALLEMVRSGPVMAAAAVMKSAGTSERTDARRLLDEMGAIQQTGEKLRRLKSLLGKSALEGDLDSLSARGLFEPLRIDDMASVLIGAIA